jgi:hypothetical protein
MWLRTVFSESRSNAAISEFVEALGDAFKHRALARGQFLER